MRTTADKSKSADLGRTHVDHTVQGRSKPVVSKSWAAGSFDLQDARAEVSAQLQLKSLVVDSLKVRRTAQLQDMASKSDQIQRLAHLQAMANKTPMMVVQKKPLEGVFGKNGDGSVETQHPKAQEAQPSGLQSKALVPLAIAALPNTNSNAPIQRFLYYDCETKDWTPENDRPPLDTILSYHEGKWFELKTSTSEGSDAWTPYVFERSRTLPDLERLATYTADPKSFAETGTSLIHIGANQTGDMYHVKAALSLFSGLCLYIWGVPRAPAEGDAVANNAVFTAVQMAEYLAPHAVQIIWSDGVKPTAGEPRNNLATAYADTMASDGEAHGFMLDVGQATSLVAYALNHGRLYADTTIRRAMADGEGVPDKILDNDLRAHGFRPGTAYVLVNYRNVANKPGGVHPEHDTGTKGFRQLQAAVARTGAVPVPMGDPPIITVEETAATLESYWTWPSIKGRGRNAEARLIQYLAANFGVVGAVGMRSGTLDLLAFAGIPILSIDVDPVLRSDPEDKPTWSRTNKLESAYGSSRYGTIYTNRGERREPSIYAEGHVEGEFNEHDLGYLEEELMARHGDGSRRPVDYPRHSTHPYGYMKAKQADRFVRHIKQDAEQGRLKAAEIARDRKILYQLKIVAEAAYNQRDYARYDPLWDTVYNKISTAEAALSNL